METLKFETNFKMDLKYLFSKVKRHTVRYKKGKLKINLRFIKQYITLLICYIKYIHIKPFLRNI
jgi:hypothetical protein